MRNLLIIVSVLLLNGYAFANDTEQLIDSANNAYANSEFERAIDYYQEILNEGYEAAEIYFNLGNAYYKSNQLTDAIINYERALKFAPGDDEINFNLNIARQYVVDKIDVLPRLFIYDWIDSFMSLFSSDKWSLISMATFIGLLILLLIYFFTNKIAFKKFSFWISILLLFITIISFVSAKKKKDEISFRNSAIIYSPSVTLKSSPDNQGTDLFVLHEGTKVMLEDSVQNWYEIKLSDGNKGWLNVQDIVIL